MEFIEWHLAALSRLEEELRPQYPLELADCLIALIQMTSKLSLCASHPKRVGDALKQALRLGLCAWGGVRECGGEAEESLALNLLLTIAENRVWASREHWN